MNKRALEHIYTTPVPKRARTDGSDLLTSTPLTNSAPLSLASSHVPASPSAFETFPAKAFTQFVQDIKYKATRALQENEEADAALARERQWRADKEKKLLEKQALLERLLKEKEEAVETALDRAIEEAQRPVPAKRLAVAKLQTQTNTDQSDSEDSFAVDNDEISGQEDVSEDDLTEGDEEEGEYSEYSADDLALPGDQRPAIGDDVSDDEDDEESEGYDPPQDAQPLEILSSDDDDIRHSFRRQSATGSGVEYEKDLDVFGQDDEASLAEYEEAASVDEQSGGSVMFAEETEVAIDPELEGSIIVQAQPNDILITNDLPQESSRVLSDELAEQYSAEASDGVPEELIPVFDDDDEAIEASSAELNNEEDRYDNEPEEDHVPIDVLLERGDELSEQDLNTLRSTRHDDLSTIDTTTQVPAELEPTVIEDLPEAVADVSVEEMLFQEMDRARRLSQLEQQRPIHLLVPHSLELPIAGDQAVSRRSSDAPRESVDGSIYAKESSIRGLPPRKRSDATKRPLLDTGHHALNAPVFALSPVADSPARSPQHSGKTHELKDAPPDSFREIVIHATDGMEPALNFNKAAEAVVDVQNKVAEAALGEPLTARSEQEVAVVREETNALLQLDDETAPLAEHAMADAAMHHSIEETTSAAVPAEPIIEDFSHIVDATEKGFHVARSADQVVTVQDKLVEDPAGSETAPMGQAEAAIFDKEAEYLALLDAIPSQASQKNVEDTGLVLPAVEQTMVESPAPIEALEGSIIPDALDLGALDDDAFERQAESESDSVSTQGDLADFVAEAASEHDETERVGDEDEPSTVDVPTELDQPDQASMQDTITAMENNKESAEEAASQVADAPGEGSKMEATVIDDASHNATSPNAEVLVDNEVQGAASTEQASTSEAVVAHHSSDMASIEEESEAHRPVDAIEEEPEASKPAEEDETVERLQTPPPVDNPEEILHTHTLAPTSPVPVIVHRLRDGAEYVDDGHDLSMLAEHDESHHEAPALVPRKQFQPRVVIRRSSRSTRGATPDDTAIAEASVKSNAKVKNSAAPTKSARQTRQASVGPAEGERRSQRKK